MQKSEIYIVETKYGKGAFGITEAGKDDYFYSFCPDGKFVPWVTGLIKEHPFTRLKCVNNEGIAAWLEKRKEIDDLFAKKIIVNLQQEK